MDEPVSFQSRLALFARSRPSDVAIVCESEKISWGKLDRSSNAVAHNLLSLGVRANDLVSFTLATSVEFMQLCWGIWKLGATPQPLSNRVANMERERILKVAKPRIFVTHDGEPGSVPLSDLLVSEVDHIELPEQVANSWKAPTSGGSTGEPKIILSTSSATFSEGQTFGLSETDKLLLPAPLYHNAPFGFATTANLVGCPLYLTPRFDAERTLEIIAREKITFLYVVPTMMHRISRLPEQVRQAYDMSSLQTVWHMAEPCPPWLKRQWIEWLGGEKLWELYGGTEAIAMTIIRGDEWLSHEGSVGKAVPPGELMIADENGNPLPANMVGEIFMRRDDGVSTYAYLGNASTTKVGGWESLGDMGHVDEQGYLYLSDRKKDMVLIGGVNIYPAEIEFELLSHPSVRSCAVVGAKDAATEQNYLHAFIEADAVMSEEDLDTYLSDRLQPIKHPKKYTFVQEPIRDDSGKVRRSTLATQLKGTWGS